VSILTPSFPTQKPGHASFTVLAVAAAIALLYFGRIFFITLVIAAMITFILDPLVNMFMKMRLPRSVASFVVCSMSLLVVYLFGLGLYTQASKLIEELPAYSQRINDLADATAARVENVENATYRLIIPKRFQERDREIQQAQQAAQQQVTNSRKARRRSTEPPPPPPIQEVRIKPEPTPLVNYVYTYLSSFYNVLLMASFVPFLVYFMLSWRDHIGRGFVYLLNTADRQVAGRSWEGVGEMVRAFVIGNFILGLLLAVASAVCFSIFHLPYAVLIGLLSGFLSLVPYVGMPLAVIPPMLAALAIYYQPVIYVIIGLTVALLHLIALNLLYPKIVGAHVHLNPLVVTIALMFWGTLWGGIGLILAIPITAGIKAVCDNVESLQPYSKLLGN